MQIRALTPSTVVDLGNVRFHAGVQLLYMMLCNQEQNAILAREQLRRQQEAAEKEKAAQAAPAPPQGGENAAAAPPPPEKVTVKPRSLFQTINKLRGVAFNVLRDKRNAKKLNWGRRVKRHERRNLQDVFVAAILAKIKTDSKAVKEFLSLNRERKADGVMDALKQFCVEGKEGNGPPPKYVEEFSKAKKAERKAARLAARKAVEPPVAAPQQPEAPQPVKQPLPPVEQVEDKEDEENEDDGFLEDVEEEEEEENAAARKGKRDNELRRLRAAVKDAELYGTEVVEEPAEEKEEKTREPKAAHTTVLFPGSEAMFGAPHVLLTRGALLDVANRVLQRFRVSHFMSCCTRS